MTDDTHSLRWRLLSRAFLAFALATTSVGATGVQAGEAGATTKVAALRHSADAKLGDIQDVLPKLGQFFIFGLPGEELTESVRRHIRETGVSAFILFRRNLRSNKQVAALTTELHRLAVEQTGGSALIGIDQEGGKVIRIPFRPAIPSAYALGQTRDPELIENVSLQVGRALRQLGFNLNFAPVLDLGTDQQYSFLGQRAFSSDPIWTSDFGAAYARGQVRARVLPVAKHFPGIGPVPNDPHLSLVRRAVSAEELRTRDLVPFENFVRIPESGIMISHLIYPALDPNTPGTFSKAVVRDLLQTQLGYGGLVVTDDLMMEGARASRNFETNIVRAFEAGADLMMITWSMTRQKQAVRALAQAVTDGRISVEDVRQRLAKMKRIRGKVQMDRAPYALDDRQLLVYNFKTYENVIDQAFQKSLSVAGRKLSFHAGDELYVLPQQAKLFEGLTGPKAQPLTAQAIRQKLKKSDTTGTWILFVRGRADAAMAAAIPQKVRSRVLLVNLWRPDANIGGFPNEVGLFMSHPKAEQWLAAWINERVLQSRVRPSDGRPRFGLLPSHLLQGFPSVNDFQGASAVLDPLSH